MSTKTVSTTNASKRGGNNKTGKGGFGDRPESRNTNGQRSAAAVRIAAEMRELYVKYLNQPVSELKAKPNASIMETIALRHLHSAANGNADEREKLYDRIWGKNTEKLDATVNGTLNHEHSGNLTIEQLRAMSDDELARVERDALGAVATPTKRW